MKDGPDFIVDSSGKVRDVRHKKYQRPHVKASKPKKPGRVTRLREDKPLRKKSIPTSGGIFIPIGLIISLIIIILRVVLLSSTPATQFYSQSNYSMLESANSAYISGDFEMARLHINIFLSQYPLSSEGYNTRGLINSAEGEYQIAIADFDQAIDLSPKPGYYNNRGVTYAFIGDYIQAIKDLDQAIQLDSDAAKPHFNRGLIYVVLEKYEEAIADFDRAIEYSDNIEAAQLARSTLSSIWEDMHLYDRLFLYGMDVDLGSAYYWRGMVYLLIGDIERYNSDFEKAIEYGLDPSIEWDLDQFFYEEELIQG